MNELYEMWHNGEVLDVVKIVAFTANGGCVVLQTSGFLLTLSDCNSLKLKGDL